MAFGVKCTEETNDSRLLPGVKYEKEAKNEQKREVCPLTNDIFRQEMLHIYEQKSESRDELVRQARREMKKLSQEMRQSLCSYPEVENLMAELSQQLETVKGKKSYGYLSRSLKPLVDRIVDEIERLRNCKATVGTYLHSGRNHCRRRSERFRF